MLDLGHLTTQQLDARAHIGSHRLEGIPNTFGHALDPRLQLFTDDHEIIRPLVQTEDVAHALLDPARHVAQIVCRCRESRKRVLDAGFHHGHLAGNAARVVFT